MTDRDSNLEVSVAQLVVKLDALTESMKVNIDRLIEKMEHGDREGATLFRLIEERLGGFQKTVEPRINAIEAALAGHRLDVEKRLDVIEGSLAGSAAVSADRRWIWGAVIVGGAGLVLAVLGFFLRG